MTRTEFFFKELPLLKIFYPCPGNWIHGAPKLDSYTLIVKKSQFIGCRGKTCKECWSEEVGNV